MKKRNIMSSLFIVCLAMILPAHADQYSDWMTDAEEPMTAVPIAVINAPRFRFPPVIDGTRVVHDFIIENAGNAPLSIEKVKTDCGCTTAAYTKVIQPGAEGKITIEGNTNGYAGRRFSKTITVYTNDPQKKQLKLGLSGKVEQFAHVEPVRTYLRGMVGDTIQSVISVISNEKYPFRILSSYSDDLEEKAEFTLEEKDDKYLITVSNLMETSGRYRGRIHLKTDSPVKPEIILPVFGIITEKKS